MRSLIKKALAVIMMLLILFFTSCQILAESGNNGSGVENGKYKVFITRARNNGKYYWDTGNYFGGYEHYQDTRISDFYVGIDKDSYSYFCLDGGRSLRDYDVGYDYKGEAFGTYTKKYPLSNNAEEMVNQISSSLSYQSLSSNEKKAIAWLIRNIYTVGVDKESEDYMMEHLNQIIKKYYPDKNINVKNISDKEIIEIIEQMVIWGVTNNEGDSYNYETWYGKSLENWNRYFKIKSDVTDKDILANDISYDDKIIAYYLFQSLFEGAKNQETVIDLNNQNEETLEIEKSDGFGLDSKQNGNKVTNKLGPIKVKTKASKDKINSQFKDSIKILGGEEIENVKYCKGINGDIKNKMGDVLNTNGEETNDIYLVFDTNELINGRIVYEANANFGLKIKDLKGNIYTSQYENESRQPILQLQKELKEDVYNNTIMYSARTNDIELTNEICKITHVNQNTEYNRFNNEDNLMEKQPLYVQYGDTIEYKITIYNKARSGSTAKIENITDYVNSYLCQDGIEVAREGKVIIDGQLNGNYLLKEKTEQNFVACSVDNQVYYYKTFGFTNNAGRFVTIDLEANKKIEMYIKTTVEGDYNPNAGTETPLYSNLYNFADISKYGFISNNTINWAETDGVDNDSKYGDFKVDDAVRKLLENQEKIRIDTNDINGKRKIKQNELSLEDDDDFETVRIGEMDLALRQYVSRVNNTSYDDREPQYNGVRSAASLARTKTADYRHIKDSIKVEKNDEVEFSIRVYNEGFIDGYVREITYYLPAGLEFVESKNPEWEIEKNSDGSIRKYEDGSTRVKTKVNSQIYNNLLSAGYGGFRIAEGFANIDLDEHIKKTGMGFVPQYVEEIKVICKVGNTNNVSELIGVAEITEYEAINNVMAKDRDSTSGNVFKYAKNNSDDKYKISNLNDYRTKYADTIYEQGKDLYFGLEDDDDFELLDADGEYSIELYKVDEDGNPMSGVTFSIDGEDGQTTDSNGYVVLRDSVLIDENTYQRDDSYEITEIETLSGYLKLKDPIEIFVKKRKNSETNRFEIKKATFAQELRNLVVPLENGTDNVNLTISNEYNKVVLRVENKAIKNQYNVFIKKVSYDYDQTQTSNLGGIKFKVGNKVTEATDSRTGFTTALERVEINSSNVNTKDSYDITEIFEEQGDLNPREYLKLNETITLKVEKEYNANTYEYKVKKAYINQTNIKLEDGTPVAIDVSVNGNSIIVTIPNKKIKGYYDIQVLKVDENNKPLKQAKFKIDGVEKETNSEGYALLKSGIEMAREKNDNFILEESKSPTGYYKIDGTFNLNVITNIVDYRYNITSATLNKTQMQDEGGNTVNISVEKYSNMVVVKVQNYKQSTDLKLSMDVVQATVNSTGNSYSYYEGRSKETSFNYNNLYSCQLRNGDWTTVIYEICVENESDSEAKVDSINEWCTRASNVILEKVWANTDYRQIGNENDFNEIKIDAGNILGDFKKYVLTPSNLYLNGNQKKYIYMEFKVTGNGRDIAYKNYAEINQGTEDIDSIYNSMHIPTNSTVNSSVIGMVSSNYGKYGKTDDDGDNVIFRITVQNDRPANGIVFLDKDDNTNDNEVIGNGIYDSGESTIKGVEVNLERTGISETVSNINRYGRYSVSQVGGGSVSVIRWGRYQSSQPNDDDNNTPKYVWFQEMPQVVSSDVTDGNGTYQITTRNNELYHGKYIIRFVWGEGSNSGNGSIISGDNSVATVDKYKSTIRIYPNNYSNWQKSSVRYSDALDVWGDRQSVDNCKTDDKTSLYSDLRSSGTSNGNAKINATTLEINVNPVIERVLKGWRI